MNGLAHEDLTNQITACAIEVHKRLVPAFASPSCFPAFLIFIYMWLIIRILNKEGRKI
jgi:hypothetical protein